MTTLAALILFSLNGEKIYCGKLDGAKKVAVIKAKSVFVEIPEYKKILEKGLTPDDPEYYTLLAAANRKFYDAVEKVARDDKYDCVAEEGSVEVGGTDATQAVIGALKAP